MTESAHDVTLLAARCPGCAAPLEGGTGCASCGLRLRGPEAARLWEVDVALGELDARRDVLLAERVGLLTALRRRPAAATPPPRSAPPVPARPTGPTPAAAASREWTTARVQNLLLSLGALLLAVAATVFGAVTYERLGVGGRAAVLLALTAGAAAAAPRLRARGLGATAESVAAVALVLALLDAVGLRRLGLGEGLADDTWAALALGTVAVAGAGYAVATRLRVPRLVSPVLAHASGLAAVSRLDPDAAQASLLLTLFAALHLVAVAALGRRPRTVAVRDLLGVAFAGATAAGLLGLGLAGLAAVLDDRSAALCLAASALLAAGGATVATTAHVRTGLAALPVPLLAGAALVLAVHSELPGSLLPVVAAAMALTGTGSALGLSRRHRTGALAGSTAVSAGALAAVGEQVLWGVLGPLTWLSDPWSLPAGATARAALSPDGTWNGSAAVVPVVLLVAATAAAAGLLLGRRSAGGATAGALGLCAVLLVPLAADLPHPASLALLLAGAAALLVAAEALRDRSRAALPALAAAVVPAAQAAAWSLAAEPATLTVLPVVALLCAVAAARAWPPAVQVAATVLAGLAGAAALAATGAARGLSAEQVGGLLLTVPALLLLLARLPQVGAARRAGAQPAAAVVAGTAVLLAAGDAGWLSWTLAGSGLLVLLVAVEADRHRLAPVGGVLVSASSWVRLADAGVDAPEPYVLPLAALALWLGHLRFTRAPGTRSQAAYGPGLALLLLPSLLAALMGTGLARPLLLGTLALGVLLVGARARLQAPLAFGAGTLVVLALELLGPYAAAAPRWVPLAAAGALLVVLGATYEQRRRDLDVLRTRYEGLR